eukprot:SM000444S16340  [mRNA]  locus=s444:25481:27387:- [translate_table: standard]
MERQHSGLRSQAVDVLVGTTGRVAALLASDALPLSRVSLFVVDGVDEIVAQPDGVKQVQEVMRKLPSPRRSIALSSSFGREATALARDVLKEPLVRACGTEASVPMKAAGVGQTVSVGLTPDKRLSKVVRLIREVRDEERGRRVRRRILVLARGKADVQAVTERLRRATLGSSTAALHEKLDAAAQEAAVKAFRSGKASVLVCQEYMAGMQDLGLGTVTMLILHDVPTSLRAYTAWLTSIACHTAHGRLHTFFPTSHAHLAPAFVDLLHECDQEVDKKLAMVAQAFLVVQEKQSQQQQQSKQHADPHPEPELEPKLQSAPFLAEGLASAELSEAAEGENNHMESAPALYEQAGSKSAERGEMILKSEMKYKEPVQQANGNHAAEAGTEELDYRLDGDEDDDEATLEEEEQLGGEAISQADELAMLEADNAMSTEELLARYQQQA